MVGTSDLMFGDTALSGANYTHKNIRNFFFVRCWVIVLQGWWVKAISKLVSCEAFIVAHICCCIDISIWIST